MPLSHCPKSASGGGKGYHAKNDQYRYQLWTYDVKTLRGCTLPPHKQEPYGIREMKPAFQGTKQFTAMAYDEANNIIYASAARAGKTDIMATFSSFTPT